MANKSPFSEILQGLKEIFVVLVRKKEIQTDFHPEEVSPSVNKENPPDVDSEPHAQLEQDTMLVIPDENCQQITAFMQNHTNLDVLSVSGFFNNEPCTIEVSAFPRPSNIDRHPQIKDIISLFFVTPYGVVGCVDYGTGEKDAITEFLNDVEEHQPPYMKRSPDELLQDFIKEYPDLKWFSKELASPETREDPTNPNTIQGEMQ